MGLIKAPSAAAAGTSLTAAQTAKLDALPAPLGYDDARALVARVLASPINANTELALNIVGGAATDISGNSREIVLSGMTIDQTAGFIGDSSYLVDDPSDQGSITQTTDFDITVAAGFSLEWAGLWNTNTPGTGYAFGKWTSSGTYSWKCGLQGAGGSSQYIQFSYSTAGTNTINVETPHLPAITRDQWHHYRIECVSNLLSFFLDGKLVHTHSLSGVVFATVSTPLTIGASDTFAEWDGNIDAIRIQNGGTVSGEEFIVQRVPFSATEKLVYQPERSHTNEVTEVSTARYIYPSEGDKTFLVTAAVTLTLPPVSTWVGFRPTFVNQIAGTGTVTLALDSAASNTYNGAGSPITLTNRYEHCTLEQGSIANDILAIGDFVR